MTEALHSHEEFKEGKRKMFESKCHLDFSSGQGKDRCEEEEEEEAEEHQDEKYSF